LAHWIGTGKHAWESISCESRLKQGGNNETENRLVDSDLSHGGGIGVGFLQSGTHINTDTYISSKTYWVELAASDTYR
jgi:hypothetical protein